MTSSGRLLWSRARPIRRGLVILVTASLATACGPPVLTQRVEARRIASDLHVQFAKAADAGNRAVMADTDEASGASAREAEQATQAVERDVEELRRILTSLGYSDAIRFLEAFSTGFAEFRKLDAEILPLAIENTNLKAQRLSFGPAREAADTFRASLEAAVKSAEPKNMCCLDALATRAGAALLEILVTQAPHIAESEDAAMTRMEAQMAASEAAARKALDELKRMLLPAAGPQLSAAAAALDRFKAINTEIIRLSRRNSEVRSLALSLGRKRTVTAHCDDQLRALEETLTKYESTGTR